jgi:parallel beta-helix repeat protein
VKSKSVLGIMFSLLLISMLTLAFNVQPVKASGTVYIRADGSIDPSTTPISTTDNITYTLIDDIYDSIVIERDNIVVEGAGHEVRGTGLGSVERGICLDGRGGVTIRNATISNFEYGIWLNCSSNNSLAGNNITENVQAGVFLFWYSSNNSISGNNITANNYDGIFLGASSDNSISGNNITNNYDGIALWYSSNNTVSGNVFFNDGLFAAGSYDNVVVDNSVNGKPLVYFENVSDCIVDDAGQVILINCNNIIVENLNLSHATVGVDL